MSANEGYPARPTYFPAVHTDMLLLVILHFSLYYFLL